MFTRTQVLESLHVYNVAQVMMAPGGDLVLRTESLQIDSGGVLDLADEDLVVDYAPPSNLSPYAAIKAALISGYNAGAWNGSGINTSKGDNDNYALGYGENSVLGLSSTGDPPVSLDATAVVVKYTYYGDANLDGMVDITDLGILATNWQMSGDWAQGDFDYSGFVDITDLGMLATNWQAGTAGNPLAPLNLQQSQQQFLSGIEKIELSEDEVSKLLEMLNTESSPTL
jgi:hypothetical protein